MLVASRSPEADDSVGELIRAAQSGSNEALGELLQRYRNYLLLIAHDGLDSDLVAKGGASDLVQETFLDAQHDFTRFQGSNRHSLQHWLREILQNNVTDFVRRYRTAARHTRRERRISPTLGSNAKQIDIELDSSAPEEGLEAEEVRVILQGSIEKLPEQYRQVLLLHHVQGMSWEETARHMQRSIDAVQKLWMRALLQLRQRLSGKLD